MSYGKVLPLATGAVIPQLGFGTWLGKAKEIENAVRTLLDLVPTICTYVEIGRVCHPQRL